MKFAVFLLLSITGTLSQFSQADKDQTLNAHNTARASLARGEYKVHDKAEPSGTNIIQLTWSSQLEKGAQAWANRCGEPNNVSKTPGIGENLWTMRNYGANKIDPVGKGVYAVEAWLREFQQFGWNPPKFDQNTANSAIVNATQVMWAESKQLGCAIGWCDFNPRVLVVCRYSPGGNIVSGNVYEQGPTCSACPKGSACNKSGKFKGLCAY